MTVAIHQPNYLPWLGYFYKIHASDVFVFHDAVQFSTRSYTKRCRIRKAKESAAKIWLSVPVRQHPADAAINEIEIDRSQDWAGSHLRKIQNTYAGSTYFETVFPVLEESLMSAAQHRLLCQCNMDLIKAVCGIIDIGAEWRVSSKLALEGTAGVLNKNIAEAVGGSVYLSGTGGKKYQQEDVFEEAGISVKYHDLGGWLDAHPYDQGTAEFVEGLSVVDALMHVGVEGVYRILHSAM